MGDEARRAWKGDNTAARVVPAPPTVAVLDWSEDSAAIGAVVRRPSEEDSSSEADAGLTAAEWEAEAEAGEETGRMSDDSTPLPPAAAEAVAGVAEEVAAAELLDAADSSADSEECLVDSEAAFKPPASRGGGEETEKRGDGGGRGAADALTEMAARGVESDCAAGGERSSAVATDSGSGSGSGAVVDGAVVVSVALCCEVDWLLARAVLLCCLIFAGAWKAESQSLQKAALQSAQSTLAALTSHTLHTAAASLGLATEDCSGRRMCDRLAAGLWIDASQPPASHRSSLQSAHCLVAACASHSAHSALGLHCDCDSACRL